MSYVIYTLIYFLCGKTWSNVLEEIIRSELKTNGYDSSFEANLHIFLWPISLGIFVTRYIITLFTTSSK